MIDEVGLKVTGTKKTVLVVKHRLINIQLIQTLEKFTSRDAVGEKWYLPNSNWLCIPLSMILICVKLKLLWLSAGNKESLQSKKVKNIFSSALFYLNFSCYRICYGSHCTYDKQTFFIAGMYISSLSPNPFSESKHTEKYSELEIWLKER